MTGAAHFDWDTRPFRRDLNNYLMRNARKSGRTLRDEVRKTVSARGTSDPGQAPGRRTGALKKSIRHVVKRSRSRQEISIRVGSGLFYSRFLEKGTKFVRARPFLARNFERLTRRMIAILVRGS